jgi:hypothetical protein
MASPLEVSSGAAPTVVRVSWPPNTGELLPRADEAWCVDEKWADWILA